VLPSSWATPLKGGADGAAQMPTKLAKVRYDKLNARQKENFNFQKVSAVLAEYGYVTFRLSDDWQGADFIALHISGDVLRVQLKSRLAFYQKYIGKGLYVAFPHGDVWYLYPHDELLPRILETTSIGTTKSWLERGGYSFAGLSPDLLKLLESHQISGDTRAAPA
jgi:hypothetical protein